MRPERRNHRWGEPVRFAYKTERECLNGCGIIKVSRHENRRHWVEFWRKGDFAALDCKGTPECEAVEVPA